MDRKELLINFLVTFVAAFLAISLFAALHHPPKFGELPPGAYPPPPPPQAQPQPGQFGGPTGQVPPGQPGPAGQVGPQGPEHAKFAPGGPGGPTPDEKGPKRHDENPHFVPPVK